MERTVCETEKAAVEGNGVLGGVSSMVSSILAGVSDLVTSVIGEAKGSRDPRDYRSCPQCAETIRAEAVKCRYCGADIAADEGD